MDSKMNKQKILAIVIILSRLFSSAPALAGIDTRQKVIEILTSAGFSDKLNAPVKISADGDGVICIEDQGSFFMQHMVVEPNVSADADLVIDPKFKIAPSADKAIIITHGWIDKADEDWPADIAKQICKRVDPNEWVCAIFDWRGGAAVVNPVNAVRYGRSVAGPRLAKAILSLGMDIKHIHLIGHSAGCWTINAAATKIAKETDADIHLTFLDAYVPPFWKESELGKIQSKKTVWAEHYYTKDITLSSTGKNLSAAHNVDITEIDPFFAEHKFPYRWYFATIAGKYRGSDFEANYKVLAKHKAMDYGFARSAEAGRENWQKSLTLKKGNIAVKLANTEKKKLIDLNIFKKEQGQKK
jgi:hypothetical protein